MEEDKGGCGHLSIWPIGGRLFKRGANSTMYALSNQVMAVEQRIMSRRINCAKCATQVQYVVTSGEGNEKKQSCLYHIPFMFRVFAKSKPGNDMNSKW